MKKYLDHLRIKWGVKRNIDFILIMVVFSLAGMTVVRIREPWFHVIGITENTPLWIKVVIYLLSIFPLYQLSLLFWGFFLGQFPFFWEKEKQLGRFFRNIFTRHSASDSAVSSSEDIKH